MDCSTCLHRDAQFSVKKVTTAIKSMKYAPKPSLQDKSGGHQGNSK